MSAKHLVIVESPAKARSISKYLGSEYMVKATIGHVIDLPPKKLGVDVVNLENPFEPTYVTIRGKGKVIAELKRAAKGKDSIILATDRDREGEMIAFHVAKELGYEKNPERFKRITFGEVTKGAVRQALERGGDLDHGQIDAQQTRRILDRLIGFKVSPFLWRPIRPGLSAGRVQTVALRIICDREDEIRAFVQDEYWSITANLLKDGQPFEARLHRIDDNTIDSKSKFKIGGEEEAKTVLNAVRDLPFAVTEVRRREQKKNPPAPFTTSTMQQAASKRLRFSTKRTMSNAQRLYEGQEIGSRGQVGLITYMRTDSTRVSPTAANQARSWIKEQSEYGEKYLPAAPRLYSGKNKDAQDAHEAVRPTDVTIVPSEAARYLEVDQAKLYEMIWLRFVASQVEPAVHDITSVDFDMEGSDGREYQFRSSGSIMKFDGFTKLYKEALEQGDQKPVGDLEALPELSEGASANVTGIEPRQHFTQPPPRYSEASLVKELEKQGIGRPSTYASIISVLQNERRPYVELEQRRFHPTDLGEVVSKLLVRVLPDIFDVGYTRDVELELDQIAEGKLDWRERLEDFYPRLMRRLKEGEENSDEIIKEILAAEGETCDKCDSSMLVRWNRYGRFLGCSAYPDCQSTRSLDGFNPDGDELGVHPVEGRMIKLKYGPYGPYVELAPPTEDEKPKRVSVPKEIDHTSVDFDYAVKLLELPRTIGNDPKTDKIIVAALGRFGPYVKRGKIYASLTANDEMWTVSLEEAVALLDAKLPLKELGKHPETGGDVIVKNGRYGPYVTDGKTNANLPEGAEPEALELQEAVKMLAEKASKDGRRRRGSKKKSAAKKATKKKPAKKKAGGSEG